jgi:hypothetical protein
VQIDSLVLRMRSRAPLDAADLGVRLCQANARSVFACYAAVGVPTFVLALALYEIADWLPVLAIWWSKPWLDRTILFVLSRAAFGQATGVRDVWREQRSVLWRQLLLTLTWRRLSPWRSFTQPVYQLEGLGMLKRRARLKLIRRNSAGPGLLVTSVFSIAETALAFAATSLVVWFAPSGQTQRILDSFIGDGGSLFPLLASVAYACVVLFLEPFYVAAGFALYLNRRTELEAWDVEQELRRAFA